MINCFQNIETIIFLHPYYQFSLSQEHCFVFNAILVLLASTLNISDFFHIVPGIILELYFIKTIYYIALLYQKTKIRLIKETIYWYSLSGIYLTSVSVQRLIIQHNFDRKSPGSFLIFNSPFLGIIYWYGLFI